LETLGLVMVVIAAVLMVLLGAYGLAPALFNFSSVSRAGAPRPRRSEPAGPDFGEHSRTGALHASAAYEELLAELFAMRQAVSEMAAEVAALRAGTATLKQIPEARSEDIRDEVEATA
jgi:hypothetical protein